MAFRLRLTNLQIVVYAIFIFLSANSFAFVRTRSDAGNKIAWPAFKTTIPLMLHLDGYHGLSESGLQDVIVDSASQWASANHTQSFALYTGSSPRIEQSDLYFSTNWNYFGSSAVLAVTQVAYDGSSGEVVAADIIINDNLNFDLNENANSSIYNIKSVITHEMGHMFGLSHGQVHSSTMFPSITSGMGTTHSDDKVGMVNSYPSGTGNSLGIISGKVVGGDSLIGVFGTHVQVISGQSGEVVGGVFSDADGTFLIKGLPLNDTYYLYLSPIGLLSSLPTYFSSRRMDFCTGNAEYRGSFYEGCSSSRSGHPQGVLIDSNNTHMTLGNITIGCDLSVPSDLLSNRDDDVEFTGLDLSASVVTDVGDSITGFFSNSSQYDQIEIDLSDSSITDSSYYLQVKVLAPALYSRKMVDLSVVGDTFDDETSEDDLTIGYLQLTAGSSPDNSFTIKIASTNTKPTASPEQTYDDLLDDYIFYQLIVSIVKKNGSVYEPYSFHDYGTLTDNSECPQAPNTYSVKAVVSSSSTGASSNHSAKSKTEILGISCGTVIMDVDDDLTPPGNGPLSFAIGFLFPLLALTLFWQLRQYVGVGRRPVLAGGVHPLIKRSVRQDYLR
jgi:hypothetical protein